MVRVKICGVTTRQQALACVKLGADAIGVNLVPESPRCIGRSRARDIASAVGRDAVMVAVISNLGVPAMRELREETGIACLQLHGDERPDDVAALLPHAYKAVRVGAPEDVLVAESMPGEYVLVDAKVQGAAGGTGRTFDWSWVASLAARRRLVLAGGLSPENVRDAIQQVNPWCVDVASGVESAPGIKDLAKVAAFVEAVRGTAMTRS